MRNEERSRSGNRQPGCIHSAHDAGAGIEEEDTGTDNDRGGRTRRLGYRWWSAGAEQYDNRGVATCGRTLNEWHARRVGIQRADECSAERTTKHKTALPPRHYLPGLLVLRACSQYPFCPFVSLLDCYS